MRIKRLELTGFKSFIDKTVIEFPHGITAIVGPNGCGKSNIVDGIRWVLGEQSYKTLRGGSMEDVIFSGSESRQPTGMAEVIITFDNQEGRIGGPYASHTEIGIGRRLFRSGESEYLINKVPARLKDIQEIFMDTGVGTRAHYAIIEQGKIGFILSSKPEDRRVLIEEAAGISKYRVRKDAALRKIDSTKQNLLRVSDVVSEVKRQMDYTNRQAQKAKRYATLKDECLGLEAKLWKVDYQEQHALLSQRNQEIETLQAEEAIIKNKISQHELVLEKQRLDMLDSEKSIQTVQEKFYQNKSRCDLLENNLVHFQRLTEDLSVRREAELSHLEQTKTNLGENKLALSEARRIYEEAAAEERQLTEGHVQQERTLEQVSKDSSQAELDLDALREGINALTTKIANGGTTLDNLDRRRIDLTGRLARSVAEMEEHQKRLNILRQVLSKDEQKLQGVQQMQLELKTKTVASQESIAELSQARSEAEKTLLLVRESLATLKSRFHVLQELQANYEGVGDGVRFIMKHKEERAENGQGVFGLVADLINLPKEYERAAEAALGERLQYIVVKSHEAGVEAIDYLNTQAAGRSAFIPLAVKEVDDDGRQVEGEGVIAPMLQLVQTEPHYEKIVKYLFGNVVVVNNLQNALKIWSRNGIRKTLVTLDGEVLDPYGVVSGGRKSVQTENSFDQSDLSEGIGLLGRKRALKDLAESIVQKQNELKDTDERVGELTRKLNLSKVEAESLQRDSHEEELRLVKQQKELSQIREEYARCEDLFNRTQQRKNEEDALHQEIKAEESSVSSAMRQNKDEKKRLVAQSEAMKERALQLKQELETRKDQVTQMRVRLASLREQKSSGEREVMRLEKEIFELELRMKNLMEAINRNNREETEIKENRQKTEVEVMDLLKINQGVESDLNQLKSAYQDRQASLQKLEEDLRLSRRKEEKLAHELASIQVSYAEDKMRVEALERHIRDHQQANAELFINEALVPGSQISADEIALARENVAALQKQIESLGEVNLASISELDELTQRHIFLVRQRDDLEQSMEALQKTILKVNRTSRERFRETFDAVNNKFQEIFPRLFGGGKASLLLTNEEDLLETGVDILCQPPGKKIQNVILLSGGEKALASICLILAIFLIKPSPFCLLDEVDAPLDDANISRFNDLLHELAKESQLILITHNRNTMEIADYLYGVTMQESGVSRMVSVRMN